MTSQRHAAAAVVALAVLLALVAPSGAVGGVGAMVAVGAAGLLLVRGWGHLPGALRRPPPAIRDLLVTALVAAIGAGVCADALAPSAGWLRGDWGPQHAVLRQLLDGNAGWTSTLSTGDAPLETYPALTYYLAAGLARLLGWEQHPLDALVLLGVLAHVGVAVGIARLAARVAPAPVAVLIGVLALVDPGALSAGSQVGIFEWGILHSAVAQALALIPLVAVVDAVRRPRLRTALVIWLGTAVAAAAHPSTLITMGALVLALGAVALLAHDVRPRRAIMAAVHVMLGLALAAPVWLPLGARILVYGQHFSNAPRTTDGLLGELVTRGFPWSGLPLVIMAGTVGMLVGVWSRRAAPVLVGAMGIVLLVLASDVGYLLLDLAPSQAVARLGATRLMQLVRPWSFAGAALVLGLLLRAARTRWQGTTPAQRRPAIVAAALLGALLLRAALPWWDGTRADLRAATHRTTSGDGEAALRAWAQAQVAAAPPGTMARALFEIGDEHYNYHLTAETGLPTLHLGATSALLLRERMPDAGVEALRRFNVRWVVAADRAPSLGDPATEQRFGRFTVRAVPGWDGAFARVEAGAGTVTTTRLTDAQVDVTVAGGPALVALGVGYYPRVRALAADGRALPVYACPATPGTDLRVPCAWLPPGAATLRFDGPLPSDGDGRGLAGLALLGIAGIVALAQHRRWRWRVLRRWVRLRARLAPHARVGGLALVALVLVALGTRDALTPTRALQVGTGLRSRADVFARRAGGGAWEACSYSAARGRFVCPGGAEVADGMTTLLNDDQGDWPFTTPSLELTASEPTDVRVELPVDLAGTYWAAAAGTVVTLTVDDAAPRAIGAQVPVELGGGAHRVTLATTVTSRTVFAMVQRATLVPPRPHRREPPPTAPF